MADMGNIAVAELPSYFLTGALLQPTLRCMVCDGQYLVIGAIDQAVGNAAPSFRMDALGVWSCYVPLTLGDNSISVDVLQAANLTPRPTLVVKANTGIGIATDQTGTAGSSSGWVTITLALTTTAEGIVLVELHNNLDTQVGTCPCYFDNLYTVP